MESWEETEEDLGGICSPRLTKAPDVIVALGATRTSEDLFIGEESQREVEGKPTTEEELLESTEENPLGAKVLEEGSTLSSADSPEGVDTGKDTLATELLSRNESELEDEREEPRSDIMERRY